MTATNAALRVSLEDLRMGSARVTNTSERDGAVYYSISVMVKGVGWILSKRYSDFHTLHKTLSKYSRSLPDLPGKTYVPSWLADPSQEIIDERQNALECYLCGILKQSVVLRSAAFHQFFELKQNKIEVLADGVVPQLKFTLNEPRFGLNDLAYDSFNGVLLSVCQDADMLSRTNTFLTNIKLPWEKSVGNELPLGVLNVWSQNESGAWDVSAFKDFDSKASAIAWDPPRFRAFVGFESGEIKIFEIKQPYTRITELKSIFHHTARVSSLIYDNITDLLISSSRDKTVSLYHVEADALRSSVSLSESWIMSMVFDSVNHQLFCGTYSGTIHIIDIIQHEVRPVHTLDDHSSCARALYYHPDQMYLFSGAFDGTAYVYQVGEKGKEYLKSRPLAVMRDGPKSKIKSIVFCAFNRQIVTGHDNGLIACWNSGSGALDAVIPAHDKAVVSLKYLDGSKTLVSGSRDGNVRFWKYYDDTVRRKSIPREVKLDQKLDLGVSSQ